MLLSSHSLFFTESKNELVIAVLFLAAAGSAHATNLMFIDMSKINFSLCSKSVIFVYYN